MNVSNGVHLHVHSHESELDGLSTPEELAQRAKELGMKALGLTDHGVMGGIPDLAKACQERGIKPIPGCEIYTTKNHLYKGDEINEIRDSIIEEYKIEDNKGKYKKRELNSFINLCRRKSYNVQDKELVDAAQSLLMDSYMNKKLDPLINQYGTFEAVSLGLIRDIYKRLMPYGNYHLLVLAKNNKGLQNLHRITSDAHLHGFYRNPRTDLEYIRENNLGEGLIGTTACLGGYFAQVALAGDLEEAARFVNECENTFEHFFVEKQATHIPEQIKLNQIIDDMISEGMIKVKKILTTDVHYARKEDIGLHDAIVASATKKCILDEDRLKYDEEFWIKSDEEMMHGCNDWEAWTNTLEVADLVDVKFETEPLLPVYEEGIDAAKMLEEKAISGLIKRLKQEQFNLEEYIPRLEYELSIINQMGFADYFLVVQDYVRASLDAGYPVGPGRGSAAGSLVCYALEITQIDPIEYGLIFERFLNPERIGLPDIDLDFTFEGTQYVFKYLQEKYGEDKVAQIGTKQTFGGKSVCKHIGSALGYTVKERNDFANEINESTLEKSYNSNEKLKEYVDKYPKWWNYMTRIEGHIKSKGVHAGGVVLSPDPIYKHMPLRTCKKGLPTTEYDMDQVEKRLVKFDVLKLETLDIVYLTLKLANIENEVNINNIRVDDKDVYKNIYQAQLLSGIFQVESDGMKSTMAEVIPSNFHDLSAIIALYRPGPLQFIPVYARRKHKKEAVTYPDDRLKDILEDTYGVWIYQEQLMHASVAIAGFSQGQADILRKAVASKNPELADEWIGYVVEGSQKHNIEGGIARGYDRNMLMRLKDQWMEFSQYSFNKSHSDAYAFLSYVTAWLKNYYPVEFMAALMTAREGKRDDNGDMRNNEYISESKKMGILVLPPKLGVSQDTWTPIPYSEPVEGKIGEIRQAITSIAGVSENGYKDIKRIDMSNLKSIKDLTDRIEYHKENGFFILPENMKDRKLKNIKNEILENGIFDKIEKDRNLVWEEFQDVYVYEDDTGVYVSDKPLKRTRVNITKSSIIGMIKSGALDHINPDRVALMHEYYDIRGDDRSELPERFTKEVLIEWETESLGSVVSISTRFNETKDGSVTQWTGEVTGFESWVAKSSGKKHYRFTLKSKGEDISCLMWGYLYGRHSEAMKEGNKVTLKLEKSKDKMIVKSVSKNFEEPNIA